MARNQRTELIELYCWYRDFESLKRKLNQTHIFLPNRQDREFLCFGKNLGSL